MFTEEQLKSEIMVLLAVMPRTKEEINKLKGRAKNDFYFNFGKLTSIVEILDNKDSKEILKSWLSDLMLSEV